MTWVHDHRRFLRDAGVALALYLLLLALTQLSLPAVQIPGYLLIVGFDAPQNTVLPGLSGVGYPALFGLYLGGLAALAGRLASRLRRRFGPAGRLRYGLAGGLLAIVLVLLAAAVVIAMPNVRQVPGPVVLAVAIGLAGLWVGTRLAAWREPTE
jgi:hypothetical protein